jgi:hypothetical protein
MRITTGVCLLAVLGLGASAPQTAWRLDDFEDGDRVAASGLAWGVISDAMQGGASRVQVAVVEAGVAGSRRALRISGVLAEKGYAGTWVALDGSARIVDVSAFSGIRMRARGKGDVLVGLRGGAMPMANFMARHTLGDDWSQLVVPFDSLLASGGTMATFDAKEVRWLGVQPPPETKGEFAFEIDEVELYRGDGSAVAARPIAKDGPTWTMRTQAGSPSELPAALVWRELAQDGSGDGKSPGLADATALSVAKDPKSGMLWFRIGLAKPPADEGFGLNLAFDLDGKPDNGLAWWGVNNAFRFDRVVTAYVHLRDGDVYQGMLGVTDAAGVSNNLMVDARFPAPRVFVDQKNSAFVIGLSKEVFEGAADVSLLAAVGSAFVHNDDVPDKGALRLGR